jgi:DNA-binding transcriptional MerR regulator
MSDDSSAEKVKKPSALPPIPDKIYFTIGEVSVLCKLKPHVLRYWEREFSQLRPSKRRGNRRYYQRQDVLLVRRIKHMLYDRGFTIGGARAQLEQEGGGASLSNAHTKKLLSDAITVLEKIVKELM